MSTRVIHLSEYQEDEVNEFSRPMDPTSLKEGVPIKQMALRQMQCVEPLNKGTQCTLQMNASIDDYKGGVMHVWHGS